MPWLHSGCNHGCHNCFISVKNYSCMKSPNWNLYLWRPPWPRSGWNQECHQCFVREKLVSGCGFLRETTTTCYDEKLQCYAKDNRVATNCMQWWIWCQSNNNKRLRSRYHTVEADYWRTQSIARFLCNNRATHFQWRPLFLLLFFLHSSSFGYLTPMWKCGISFS